MNHKQNISLFSSGRRAARARRHFRKIIKFIALVTIVVIAGFAVTHLSKNSETENQSFEKNYFSDSKYDGISSHIIERNNTREEVFLEFPKTEISAINTEIERIVYDLDAEFKGDTTENSNFEEKKIHKMSYQIFFSDENWLSLAIFSHRQTHGAHPDDKIIMRTFDKKTGEIIRFSKITTSENHNKFISIISEKISKNLSEKNLETSEHDFENLDFNDFENFILLSKTQLRWEFSSAEILPHSFGNISFEITTKELAEILNETFAPKIVDFEKPKKEEPQPQAQTQNTPQAQPSPAPTPVAVSPDCENCVALTFDDGPRIGTTDRLLDILDSKNARATFFVLGPNAQNNANIIIRMKNAGHEIGNHTWTHPQLPKLTPSQISDEISKTNTAIEKITGEKPKLLRQPYGATNAITDAEMKKLGMSGILWSVDTRDWADRDANIVCNRAVTSARAGSVILLHDIHATSVEAVPCIIDGLAKKGLTTATVSQIFKNLTPGQNYHSAN